MPLVLLAAATLAGCSEKPQILAPQDELASESQHRSAELRERTLNQGESDRMSY
jgi:predicted small lipoprotein YifL